MAGDWIKMRSNLWDDPRVAKLADLTSASEAEIIGGLYWLWATADQHSEDGILVGLTVKTIDRKTGIDAFGNSLISIGWLENTPEGVRIVRFSEHNGQSAKRRCGEARRKISAYHADKKRKESGQAAEKKQKSCGSREREREEKENKNLKPKSPYPSKGELTPIGGEVDLETGEIDPFADSLRRVK
jgi:hypothetical protein